MANDTTILVVDDDKRLRNLLDQYLSGKGYRVFTAEDTRAAREILRDETADLLVMDVMMPDETGIEFTQNFKQNYNTPILLLTAMGEVEDRIAGLESGADDYLSKPFEPRELLLRIKNLVRRPISNVTATTSNEITFGNYVYNKDKGELHELGSTQDIPLSANEQTILSKLAAHLNATVSREDLATALNGISERSVDVQITRLRKRIEADPRTPQHLRTMRGQGYVLKGETN
jgi:two-component system phosphate regulon response regulator OmpR